MNVKNPGPPVALPAWLDTAPTPSLSALRQQAQAEQAQQKEKKLPPSPLLPERGTITPAPEPMIPATVREAARQAAFGVDKGWDGWADAGPAGKREDGKYYNRLGLESTETHRHVAKAWQEAGCTSLPAFRAEQETLAEAKWDRNDLSLMDLTVMDGAFLLPRVGMPITPTTRAIYQLAELSGAKPAQVMALYDCEWDTLARRERGEERPLPSHAAERRQLADEILNRHLHWLPEKVRTAPRLFRFRNTSADTAECRAVLSNRYGIIDHTEVLEILWEAIPAKGRDDVLVTGVEDDGNKLMFSLFFPDYIKTEAPDSEYGVGLRVQDSEDGTWANEYDAFLFRACCWNGYRYGVRQKKQSTMRKIHLGQIDKAVLIAQARQAIQIGLSEGMELFRLNQLTRDVRVPNPAALLALTAHQAKITKSQSQILGEAYRREPEPTGFGIVQAWTRAAQAFSGDQRTLFERTGAALMAPSLKADATALHSHWGDLNNLAKRLAQKSPETVERFVSVMR